MAEPTLLLDVRCLCNRLLFRGIAQLVEIKCPNCKRVLLIEPGQRTEIKHPLALDSRSC